MDKVRAARVVRMMRLIRLIRVMKLYNILSKKGKADEAEKEKAQARLAMNAKQAALKRVEASRLGKILAERTTRKVIILVLVMLFVMPWLTLTTTDYSKEVGAQNFHQNS